MNLLICIFFITYGIYALFNNISFWFIYLTMVGLYYYLTQVKFLQSPFNTLRKKLMIATWGPLTDPQIYAKIKLDITRTEPFLEEKSKETGERITLTIWVIKLLSIVLKKYPELYGYIKFGKYVNREGVDICCLVNVGEGQDLANATIQDVEKKHFTLICKELNDNVTKLRNKKSKEHNKKMGIVSILPTL